jgi:iron complex outermembrane receptor protein
MLLNINISASETTKDTVSLKEIEVTASRYPRSLRLTAAPVQVIGIDQLQAFPTGNLASALSSLPGVQLQSGSFQTMKLTLRGIGSRSQYGTNRTSVFLNEIPLTGGDGTAVFDDLELTFIQKAEVTKGSYSAWYGSGMGGSLRFVTRTSEGYPFFGEATLTAASAGLLKRTGMAFYATDNADMSIGVARLSGDGFRENSAFQRSSMLVQGNVNQLGVLGKLNYLILLGDVHAFTPSSVDWQTYQTEPTAAAANWLNVKGYKAYQRLMGGVRLETPLSLEWNNRLLLTTNYYDQYELRPFNILDDRTHSFTMQQSVQYAQDETYLVLGVEALFDTYTWTTLTNESMDMLADAKELRRQANLFGSFETSPVERLRVSVAVNLNSTEYILHDNAANQQGGKADRYRSRLILSPMAGLVYQLSPKLNIYTSAGHGFSNPTVEESLNSEGLMNVGMRPENGWTLDMGVKAWLTDNRLSVQGSLYAIFLNDLLVTKRPAEDVFYGANAGGAFLRGVELSMHYMPVKWLQYYLSTSVSTNQFLDFEDNGNQFYGNQLPGIPRTHFFSSILIKLPFRANFMLTHRYSGVQFADDANLVTVEPWNTLDFSLRYTLPIIKSLHVDVRAAINNLLNEHYASMILINAPSFGGRPPRYYYPAQARNASISLRLYWQ